MFPTFPLSPLVTAIALVGLILSPLTADASGNCICQSGTQFVATATTLNAACDAAAGSCFANLCSDPRENCARVLNCGSQIVSTGGSTGNRSCTISCTGGRTTCTTGATATGDPHLKGFDGSRFNFQGEPGKYYNMFGRSNGDLLVARMRAAGNKPRKTRLQPTFFDEFGLKIKGSSHQIAISLVEQMKKPGQWRPRVTVDGREVDGSEDIGSTRILVDEAQEKIFITTAETKYTFRYKRLTERSDLRHFNLKLDLVRPPKKSDIYAGVLGFTLNKVIGQWVHPELNVATRKKTALETSLRNKFGVSSLFPPHPAYEPVTLHGLVRMVVEDEVLDMFPLLSAESNWS